VAPTVLDAPGGRWVVEDTLTGQRIEMTSQEMNQRFQRYLGRYRDIAASQLR
jgi:hypothetical protein